MVEGPAKQRRSGGVANPSLYHWGGGALVIRGNLLNRSGKSGKNLGRDLSECLDPVPPRRSSSGGKQRPRFVIIEIPRLVPELDELVFPRLTVQSSP
jgi:hypothetical protein